MYRCIYVCMYLCIYVCISVFLYIFIYVFVYVCIDLVFKGGTRVYIVINKEGCASWSWKNRGNHVVFTKSLLKEGITFFLRNCFFFYWKNFSDSSNWNTSEMWLSTTNIWSTKKLNVLRHIVSLEQSIFEKLIITSGLLMTCYH